MFATSSFALENLVMSMCCYVSGFCLASVAVEWDDLFTDGVRLDIRMEEMLDRGNIFVQLSDKDMGVVVL